MKRVLAMLFVVVLAFSLAACGPKDKDKGSSVQKVELKTPEDRAKAEAEIRNAISLLLDRNYIVNNISQGGQLPASSFVAAGLTDADGKTEFYQNAGGNKDYYGYFNVDKKAFNDNYKKAIDTLRKYYDYDEKSGKFTNFPKITYLYNTGDAHKAIGEYIQAALNAVGITVELENQEWNTFLNSRKDGKYTMARNGWLADYNDPISFLDMWTTISGNNDIQLGKGAHKDLKIYNLDLTPFGIDIKVENGTWAETYDVLIGEIKKNSDNEKRLGMMHIAEDMIMATGTIVPLYFYTDIYMLNSKVEGFFSNPLGYKYFMNCTVDGKTDSLSVCIASEPDTIDPALNSAVDGATLTSHLFSGVAKWTKDESGKLVLAPDAVEELVEGVKNDDGTITYTYKLKDNMKWSDGKPVTAKDFEFAWNRAASPKLAADYCYMFDVVDGYAEMWETKDTGKKDDKGNAITEFVNPDAKLNVKAVDDKTFQVTLSGLVPYWNELLAFPAFFPVREDVVKNDQWATNPKTYISNGPYTISDWKHGSLITLKKNPNYFAANDVKMEEIKFYLSDDANNMLTNFKNGDWQLIDDVPSNEIPTLKKDFGSEFVVTGQLGTYYTCWNINKPLLPEN